MLAHMERSQVVGQGCDMSYTHTYPQLCWSKATSFPCPGLSSCFFFFFLIVCISLERMTLYSKYIFKTNFSSWVDMHIKFFLSPLSHISKAGLTELPRLASNLLFTSGLDLRSSCFNLSSLWESRPILPGPALACFYHYIFLQ